ELKTYLNTLAVILKNYKRSPEVKSIEKALLRASPDKVLGEAEEASKILLGAVNELGPEQISEYNPSIQAALALVAEIGRVGSLADSRSESAPVYTQTQMALNSLAEKLNAHLPVGQQKYAVGPYISGALEPTLDNIETMKDFLLLQGRNQVGSMLS